MTESASREVLVVSDHRPRTSADPLPGYLWRHRQGRQSADKLQGGRASPSNLASWGDLEMTVPASQPPGWRDCWKSKICSVPGRPGQAQLRVRREEEGPGGPSLGHWKSVLEGWWHRGDARPSSAGCRALGRKALWVDKGQVVPWRPSNRHWEPS